MALPFQISSPRPQSPSLPFPISKSLIPQQTLAAPSPPFSRPRTTLSVLTSSNLSYSHRCFCRKPNPSLNFDNPSLAKIFIRGLPKSTSEGSLRSAFSQFGEVAHVKIMIDNKTRESLGFANIVFSNEEDAQLAIKEMDGKFFQGRFICVTDAKPGATKDRGKANPYKF